MWNLVTLFILRKSTTGSSAFNFWLSVCLIRPKASLSILYSPLVMERKRKNHKRYCIALGCHNNTKTLPNLSLFKLPKDPERMREWLRILGREDLLHREDLKPSSYEVCCFHFDESSIKVIKLLKADATPARVALDRTRDTESKGSVSSVAVQTDVIEQSFQTRKAQPSMKAQVMETSKDSE